MLAGEVLSEKAYTIEEQFADARREIDHSLDAAQKRIEMVLTVTTILAYVAILFVFIRCMPLSTPPEHFCNLHSSRLQPER